MKLNFLLLLYALFIFSILIITSSHAATITLDAGHGGIYSGATYENIAEKDINLTITRKLCKSLETTGHTVIMTRVNDEELNTNLTKDLILRQHKGNNSTLFISIHCNAATNPKATGFEVWTTKGQDYSDLLATYILIDFPLGTLRTDMSDGDIDKEANFLVLKGKVPSVLLELGFMSNHKQLVNLCTPEIQNQIVHRLTTNINTFIQETQAN